MTRADAPIVEATQLRKAYMTPLGEVIAVQSATFRVESGKTLAIIGESGSGKTTVARMVTGLEQPVDGTVRVAGKPSGLRYGKASLVQAVFQDPFAAINTRLSLEQIVTDSLRGVSRVERRSRAREALAQVNLGHLDQTARPSKLSGGQLQRLVIARALMGNPALLVADEPTSALDVSAQGAILDLLLRAQQERGFAMILITHDLPVAKVLADEVLVMRAGEQIEYKAAGEFFAGPSSDYAKQLFAAAS